MSAQQWWVSAAVMVAIGLASSSGCSKRSSTSDDGGAQGSAGSSGPGSGGSGGGAAGGPGVGGNASGSGGASAGVAGTVGAGGNGSGRGGSGPGTGGSGPGTGGSGSGTGGSGSGTGGNGSGRGGSGGSGACPASEPARSSACSASSASYCYFTGRTVCSCDPEAGPPRDGGTLYSWNCGNAPTGCPQTVPAANSACNQAGQQCSYDFRPCAAANPSMFTCEGGTWRFTPKPCS